MAMPCDTSISSRAETLIEWLPCLPCLFVRGALPLYAMGALLALIAHACVRRRHASLARRLQRQVRQQIWLAGVTLAALFLSPWLLAPESRFASLRLLAALSMLPLQFYPVGVLVALCFFRSAAAWFGKSRPSVEAG